MLPATCHGYDVLHAPRVTHVPATCHMLPATCHRYDVLHARCEQFAVWCRAGRELSAAERAEYYRAGALDHS